MSMFHTLGKHETILCTTAIVLSYFATAVFQNIIINNKPLIIIIINTIHKYALFIINCNYYDLMTFWSCVLVAKGAAFRYNHRPTTYLLPWQVGRAGKNVLWMKVLYLSKGTCTLLMQIHKIKWATNTFSKLILEHALNTGVVELFRRLLLLPLQGEHQGWPVRLWHWYIPIMCIFVRLCYFAVK